MTFKEKIIKICNSIYGVEKTMALSEITHELNKIIITAEPNSKELGIAVKLSDIVEELKEKEKNNENN